MQAAACIWIVQKSVGNEAFKISTFLLALPKVTSRITDRGHALYQRNTMLPLLEQFDNTLKIISQTIPQAQASLILDNSKTLYLETLELFEYYMNLFKIVIKFDRIDYSDVHMNSFTPKPALDIFRFGWAMLLYATKGISIFM